MRIFSMIQFVWSELLRITFPICGLSAILSSGNLVLLWPREGTAYKQRLTACPSSLTSGCPAYASLAIITLHDRIPPSMSRCLFPEEWCVCGSVEGLPGISRIQIYFQKFLVVPPHLHTTAADQARRIAEDPAGQRPIFRLGLSYCSAIS